MSTPSDRVATDPTAAGLGWPDPIPAPAPGLGWPAERPAPPDEPLEEPR
jgi:hypothetical protein